MFATAVSLPLWEAGHFLNVVRRLFFPGVELREIDISMRNLIPGNLPLETGVMHSEIWVASN